MQISERIWIDSDSGKVTWATADYSEVPCFDLGDLWVRVEPLWGSLQHSIRKYTNQMMYLRSQQQTSTMTAVSTAQGRGTPNGYPGEVLSRRGSGSIVTNKSADFGNFSTV